MKRKQWLALLAALFLLAGCGGGKDDAVPPPEDPAPVQDEVQTTPSTSQPEEPEEPTDTQPVETEPTETQPSELAPTEPEPAEAQPAETEPVEPAGPEPAEPESQPEEKEDSPELSSPGDDADQPPQSVADMTGGSAADGTYTASVTLEGGTGRAKVESPATLRCEDGKFYATIVWSSSSYDYMKVDGEKYLQTSTEGNSTFEIPVSAFDQKLDVIADTIAMSEPHEIEYTLYFDSASLQKQ